MVCWQVAQSIKQRDVSRIASAADAPARGSLDAELAEGGLEVTAELKARQEALMQDMSLQQYAIAGDDAEWEQALSHVKPGGQVGSVSVMNTSGKKKHGKKRDKETPKKTGKKRKTTS